VKHDGKNDERDVDRWKISRQPRWQIDVRHGTVVSTERFRHPGEGAPEPVRGEDEGEFKWSSQHLEREVWRWVSGSVSERSVRCGGRCGRRVGRRRRDARIESGSRTRSLVASRASRRPRCAACHPRLGPVGSVRVVGCRRTRLFHSRDAICRSRSERRSRSCMPNSAVYARSLAAWVVDRRRSRVNCAATRRPAAIR
jgi:hypothetical protein